MYISVYYPVFLLNSKTLNSYLPLKIYQKFIIFFKLFRIFKSNEMLNSRALNITLSIAVLLGIGITGAVTYYMLKNNNNVNKNTDSQVCVSDVCYKYGILYYYKKKNI